MLIRGLFPLFLICPTSLLAQVTFPKDSVAPDGTHYSRLISKLSHEDSIVLNHVAEQFQIKPSVGLANEIIRANKFTFKQTVIQPDGIKLRAYDFSDPYNSSPFVVKISDSNDSLIRVFSFTDEEYIIRHEIYPPKYRKKYNIGPPPEPTFKRNFEENLNSLFDILGYKQSHSKARLLINTLMVDLLEMSELNWQEYFRSLDRLKEESKKIRATKEELKKYIDEYRSLSKVGIDCDCHIYKAKMRGMYGYWIIEIGGYPNDPVQVKVRFVSELFFRPNIRI